MAVLLLPGAAFLAPLRLRLRLLVLLLASWWTLVSTADAARFRGCWDDWQIEVGGKGRPSVQRVLAEVDAFAVRHGFVRHPEREASGNVYTHDYVHYLPVQERWYTFTFDPAKREDTRDIVLTLSHNGDEPVAELRMLAPPDERAWQVMERCRTDFLREFPARYGKRHVEETRHLQTDRHGDAVPEQPAASHP